MIFTAYTVNCDCSKISCEEFINLMIEGYHKAVENHRKHGEPIKIAYNDKRKNDWIEEHNSMLPKMIEIWKTYAKSKWVTEKRQQRYIDEETIKYMTYPSFYSDNWSERFDSPSFFDIEVQPGEMGKHSYYIIDKDSLNMESLKQTYDALQNNKYFMNASGWTYDIDCGDEGYGCHFRPQINMLVLDELKKEMNDKEYKLNQSVSEFYKNTTYFGD